MAQAGALYLDPHESKAATTRSGKKPFLTFFSFILALGVFASLLSFVSNPQISSLQGYVAFAETECDDDEDCDQKTLDEAWDAGDYKSNQSGFDKIMDDIGGDKPDQDSILYGFYRHFTPGYMNEGDKAYVAEDWYKEIWEKRSKHNCGKGYKDGEPGYPGEYGTGAGGDAGNLVWHNCDVPNLITEFAQDLVVMFFEPGMVNATTESSYSASNWFGYASSTPDVVDQNGPTAVTALEVFGYNMKFTSYRGEWDYIKVMNSARALANFGFMDKLKLGAQAIVNGIVGGVGAAVNTLMDDLKSGNVVRIITSPLRAIGSLFSGGVKSTLDTVIDTSDTNVFATYSWYRPDFGNTLYNARQMSQDEVMEYIQEQLAQFLLDGDGPERAEPPADLKAVSPNKLRAISPPSPGQCTGVATITPSGGDSYTENFSSTVLESQAACTNDLRAQARAKYPAADGWGVSIATTYAPKKTVDEWKAEAGAEAVAEKYQMYCTLAASSGTDPSPVTNFLTCWEREYPKAVIRETATEQTGNNQSWWEKKMQESAITAFFRKQAAAFTSPSARYICLNEDGTDKMEGGKLVKLVIGSKDSMRLNPKCDPVRKPIQNGLFGNGYLGKQPPEDTRRSAFSPDLWDITMGDELYTSIGLNISKFSTQVANTVLNMSFSPLLKELGIDTILTKLIEGFRDSLFFPLVALMIAIGAATTFFTGLTKRNYGEQIKTILLMIGVFFTGTILMTAPAKTIMLVDTIPATVETAIIGTIFEVGGPDEDNLCRATSSPSSTLGTEDGLGNVINFDPAASARTILCENWRVFALTPYVYGQWGTNYANLDGDKMNLDPEVQATVGDPIVQLGSNTENNWALYQLDLLTAGTTTTYDPTHSKTVDPNLYRIVDMQAGPNNGQGTDSRYFDSWRGENMILRILAGLVGAVVSVVGAVTVILFAYAKIKITLIVSLMILFMPFMFLIGLLPGQGMSKLKNYGLEIVSLMVQRVVLITLIALMLKIIVAVGTTSGSFFFWATITIAVCMAFLINRSEILRIFDSTITRDGGGMKLNASEYMPRAVQQRWRAGRAGVAEASRGAIGGFMAGGVQGARAGAAGGAQRAAAAMQMKQGREGYAASSVALRARKEAKAAADKKFDENFGKLEPIAKDRAKEKLAEELGDERLVTPDRLAEATRAELERMRPTSKKDKRVINERARIREGMDYTSDRRSSDQVANEIRQTAADPSTASLDALTQRAEDLKPELVDNKNNRSRVEKNRALAKDEAEILEKSYVKNSMDEVKKESREQLRKEVLPQAAKVASEIAKGKFTGDADRGMDAMSDFVSAQMDRDAANEKAIKDIKADAQRIAQDFLRKEGQ